MGQDSVYWAELNAVFDAAERQIAGDSVRKAQALAAMRDCEALNRFQLHIAGGEAGTPKVLTAINIKCVDKVAAAPPPPADNQSSRRPAASGDIRRTPAPPTAPNSSLCNMMDVEEMIGQAQNQFKAGFAKAALQLMIKALTCKQDARMYRMAALYACVAHDVGNAKIYYARIPKSFRQQAVQRCQQEGINLP